MKSKHSHYKCGKRNGRVKIYRDLYKAGFKPSLIAKIFGVSAQAVSSQTVEDQTRVKARNRKNSKAWRDRQKKLNP